MIIQRLRPPRRDERGAVALELVIVVPALMIMLGLMIAGGRLWFAKSAVEQAAQSAARAGSLQRDPGSAHVAGVDAGRASLQTNGLTCGGRQVSVDTTDFAVPVGVPATLHATVTCTVSFGDILLPGTPGSITVSRTSAAALDTYRTRS
jgi:Flp pilus assembly protein TadG